MDRAESRGAVLMGLGVGLGRGMLMVRLYDDGRGGTST